MSLPHESVATIDSPQFINLQPLDINPLMSSCEIKVFYIGENRNGSYIKKDVAEEMAKSLRGAPIVGYYKESKEDFTDHGEKVVFDDEGVHFECVTKPYGFVAPNAEVWFQTFDEQDDFGNTIQRQYLMTTGYLWTGQFPEAQSIIEEGKPQSMELQDETLEGHWAENPNTGVGFFIIDDAVISKLCVLGDDVEPCFEGASVTAADTKFELNNEFKRTLFSMMKDLEFALKGEKAVSTENIAENSVETENTLSSDFVKDEDKKEDSAIEKKEESKDTQKKEEEKFTNSQNDKKEEDKESQETEDSGNSESEEESDSKKDEEEDKKKVEQNSLQINEEFEALQAKYDELSTQFSALKEQNEALLAFKNSVEDAQKDELISKFYMLSDEDKKDVIENKSNYSLEDIESKLAVICYRKKVNFDLSETSENEVKQAEENSVTTFNLNNVNESSVSDWIKEVELIQNRI